ncbi:GntR family transcriptional regulator [Streptomyces boncukensis]|uniref:GntR family transcriptional regulator n=1 Tax=Streptomyces boncukensis TaxID=2711219 RepID=A0A6G4X710_9ACTN|nr:GntR family transcriptional regulator [Streptomyces boncukensis]NGO73168.1 GntR family transcriptional regulator [Streptomyces boncukensis]
MRISAQALSAAIRGEIVAGSFPPGTRLTEELLARRFGVSRVPVREALRTLESEGFVRTRRYAGACVAEPTAQEAADLLDLRALLEPLGAARAAQRRTEAHLKVLRGLVRLGLLRAERGQLSELRSLTGWFQETLAQAAGTPVLTGLLLQLRHKIAWLYAVEAPGSETAEWQERGRLVDAIARREAERARALAVRHAERSAARYRLRAPGPGPRPVGAAPKHAVNTARDRI